MRILIAASAVLLTCPIAAAQPLGAARLPSAETCLPAIEAAEWRFALPPNLLQSIAAVESGRADPVSGHVTPWPWTVNASGAGMFFATKAAAIEAVQALHEAGIRSIDVGCMQINLTQHPDAFASLDQAFDPAANAQYGARFLGELYHRTGNWPRAAAAYHSSTEELGAGYEARVLAIWPFAGAFPDSSLARREEMRAIHQDFGAAAQSATQFASVFGGVPAPAVSCRRDSAAFAGSADKVVPQAMSAVVSMRVRDATIAIPMQAAAMISGPLGAAWRPCARGARSGAWPDD